MPNELSWRKLCKHVRKELRLFHQKKSVERVCALEIRIKWFLMVETSANKGMNECSVIFPVANKEVNGAIKGEKLWLSFTHPRET